MIVDCIGDLHGHYPELEGGDLLIVAGDLVAKDCIRQYDLFFNWLALQKYSKKVVIAGNHDGMLETWKYPGVPKYCDAIYLCDSGTEYSYHIERFPDEDEGFLPSGKRTLKIWGSPWTHLFPGVNSKFTAFMLPEEELAAKWALIPDDTDILITHSPPFTIRDKTGRGEQVGSPSLLACHIARIRPKLWVFGHIHEGYGQDGPYEWNNTIYVNASIMNEVYDPVNKPIRVIL